MSKFLYDPAALGHPVDKLADVLRRAADIAAQKAAPIELSIYGLVIDVEEDITLPKACIRLAGAQLFGHHTPQDAVYFKNTAFDEVEPGALEDHVSTLPTISIAELSVAIKTAQLMQGEESRKVGLKDSWKPSLERAGGAVLLQNDVITDVVKPVVALLEPTWKNGAWLDLTVRRELGESLDLR